MTGKLKLAGLLGALIGAATGWVGFNSIPASIGIGCALASGACGTLICLAAKSEKTRRKKCGRFGV